jgi:ABC-2 type transport system permease protein
MSVVVVADAAATASLRGRVRASLADVADLFRYRELLRNLVSREIKVRYKRSTLGLLWTMLNPLLMMVVFTVVFSTIFRFAVKNYNVYFLSAYLLWNFFSQTTTFSMSTLRNNGSLLKRIYMPRSIFVVATVISGLINLVLALVPLFLVMIVSGVPIEPAVLFLPVPILLATMFTLGLSLLLSALAIFFNDVMHVYGVLLTAWMYVTPIIYPIEIVPPEYRWLVKLNPLYYLVEAFRAPIYDGVLPGATTLLIGGVFGVAALLAGWWVFSRSADRFVQYL